MTLLSTSLTKFKLTKRGAEADYIETEHVDEAKLQTEISKKYPFQCKPELTDSFQQLVPHLMMLGEFTDEDCVDEPEDILEMLEMSEKFSVTGIVVKETGVTLIGRRTLRGKKILNITTPFLLWEVSDGMDEYRFLHHLRKKVSEAEICCLKYIEGDYLAQAANNTQLSIDFTEPPAT